MHAVCALTRVWHAHTFFTSLALQFLVSKQKLIAMHRDIHLYTNTLWGCSVRGIEWSIMTSLFSFLFGLYNAIS